MLWKNLLPPYTGPLTPGSLAVITVYTIAGCHKPESYSQNSDHLQNPSLIRYMYLNFIFKIIDEMYKCLFTLSNKVAALIHYCKWDSVRSLFFFVLPNQWCRVFIILFSGEDVMSEAGIHEKLIL